MPNDNNTTPSAPALPNDKTSMWIEGVEPDPAAPTPKVNARKVQPPLYTDRKQQLKRLQKT